jgi:hypothetical protein
VKGGREKPRQLNKYEHCYQSRKCTVLKVGCLIANDVGHEDKISFLDGNTKECLRLFD